MTPHEIGGLGLAIFYCFSFSFVSSLWHFVVLLNLLDHGGQKEMQLQELELEVVLVLLFEARQPRRPTPSTVL